MKNNKTQTENNEYRLMTEACYNPFFLSENGIKIKEIKAINFFKDGAVIASCKWLCHRFAERASIDGNNDFDYIKLPFTNIPHRKKLNFKDDAFYICVTDAYTKNLAELYLNVDCLEDFRLFEKEPKEMYNGTEIWKSYCLEFKTDAKLRHPYVTQPKEETKLTVARTYNVKCSYTEKGARYHEIEEALQKNGFKISIYDIETLLNTLKPFMA